MKSKEGTPSLWKHWECLEAFGRSGNHELPESWQSFEGGRVRTRSEDWESPLLGAGDTGKVVEWAWEGLEVGGRRTGNS